MVFSLPGRHERSLGSFDGHAFLVLSLLPGIKLVPDPIVIGKDGKPRENQQALIGKPVAPKPCSQNRDYPVIGSEPAGGCHRNISAAFSQWMSFESVLKQKKEAWSRSERLEMRLLHYTASVLVLHGAKRDIYLRETSERDAQPAAPRSNRERNIDAPAKILQTFYWTV